MTVLTRSAYGARSAPRDAYDASAAAGSARTTSAARPGSPSSAARCSRVRCRSRLFTRLRVAALPTALLTVNPTCVRRRLRRPGPPRGGPRGSREPARRPWRTVRRKPSAVVRRWTAESNGVCRELWPSDGQALAALAATAATGWRDRHGSACAGGSRAPCDGDGCSAGTYACSRLFLRRFRGMSTPLRASVLVCSAGTARPRGRQVADRGHAAPVDRERPANGTRRAKGGSNPRATPARSCLWMTSCPRLPRLLRSRPSAIRPDHGPTRVQQRDVTRVT